MAQRYLIVGIGIVLSLHGSLRIAAQTSSVPTITSLTLPSGVVGTPYTSSLVATGGTPPYTWAFTGALPAGLTGVGSFEEGSGVGISGSVIYGTPTATGSTVFSATVTDSASGSDTENITINIVSASAGITPTIIPFNGTNGSLPNALIQGADGNFYGTTSAGGTTLGQKICFDSNNNDIGCGTVFRLNSNNSISVLVNFAGGVGGSSPTGIIQGPDGNFYGTTLLGGTSISTTPYSCATYDSTVTVTTNVGCGTIFQVTPSGTFQTIYSFPGAVNGTTSGTGVVGGVEKGSFPNSLILGSGGVIYGTTGACNNVLGGSAASTACDPSFGILYEFTPPGPGSSSVQPQVIYSFGLQFGYPNSLLQAADGNLYGTAQLTDDNGEGCQQNAGCGAFFEFTPGVSGNAGTAQSLFDFTLTSTEYGNTSTVLNDASPVISPRAFGIIRQPSRSLPTGGNSWLMEQFAGSLVEAGDGSFFGTTPTATQFSNTYATEGSVFHYTAPTGSATTGTLDTISIGDWANDLVLASDGNYYGMADAGVFQINPSGTSASPVSLYAKLPGTGAGLLQGSNGNFYGVNENSTDGSIFEIQSNPSLSSPITMQFTPSSIQVDHSTTLNWSVTNAFSQTSQQCYATVQKSASGAGSWTGLQQGSLSSSVFSGSATITPTAVGTFTYALTCGGTMSGFATLTVSAAPLAVTTSTLPNAAVGTAYSATLAESGGVQPFTWTIISGSLPAGLALASSGSITGTPTANGTSTFTVQVADSESTPQKATAALTIVTSASPLSITTASTLPQATVGTAYSMTLSATGGQSPYTWSLASGTLPQGLTLSSSGTLTGTPTANGTSTFTVQVEDSESQPQKATAALTIVTSPPPLSITTAATLPQATVGTSYSATLSATGGVSPYTWSLASGSTLPQGLTLNSSGALTGTPTQGASSPFAFTIDVNDSESPAVQASQSFSLTVQQLAPSVSANPSTITISSPGGVGSTTLTFSNFAAGTISIACTGKPSETTCTTSNLTSTSATLSFSTTAPSTSMLQPPINRISAVHYALLLPGVLLLLPFWKRGRFVKRYLSLLLLLTATSLIFGCGGNSTPQTRDPGTPTGTTTVTVTATEGAQSATLPVTLTVQ